MAEASNRHTDHKLIDNSKCYLLETSFIIAVLNIFRQNVPFYADNGPKYCTYLDLEMISGFRE